jgi:hypothetical protein
VRLVIKIQFNFGYVLLFFLVFSIHAVVLRHSNYNNSTISIVSLFFDDYNILVYSLNESSECAVSTNQQAYF